MLAAAGVLPMQELVSARLIITSMKILGGIALLIKTQPARG
ncbi:MAG: hypothetical protein Q9M16_04015 [Mariprofundus sp.]|nr:hypothetical protein [Mariprofundus sp.]